MKKPKFKKVVASTILAAVVLVAVLFGWVWHKTAPPPLGGGNFTLASVHGPVQLSDYKNKAVVLYFGYTSCPDACPMALAHLRQAVQKLNEAQRQSLVPIFISVDYRHDTPAKVEKYAQYFLPQAVGLTGTKKQIDQVVSEYRTSYHFLEDKKSALGYSVQHGTNFYFINKKGILVDKMPTGISENLLVSELKAIL